jgi:hypothetical protein
MWSRDDIRRRQALLKTWLDPQADGEGAGTMAGQPYRAIVQTLRQEFPHQKISERSLQRFLRELREREPALQLQTLGRGRRRAERTEAVAAVEARRSKVALAAARREVEVGLWCELLSLTGLPRTHLHALLHQSDAGGLGLPSLSTFMARLKDVQHVEPSADVNQLIAGLRPEEHLVRLHQVTLDGPDGELRVVALAYDPKTHYVNAQLIVLHPSNRKPSRGRPLKRLAAGEAPQVELVKGIWEVRLPASWWRDFLEETRQRMRLPVVGALLCTSLGPLWPLMFALWDLDHWRKLHGVPRAVEPSLRSSFAHLSVEELRLMLMKALNQHNQQAARPQLLKRRLHVETCLAEAAQADARISAARGVRRSGKTSQSLLSGQERAERARRIATGNRLEVYNERSPIAPHRGTYLSCQPLHWLVKGLRSPPEAAEPSDGVKPAIHTPPSPT